MKCTKRYGTLAITVDSNTPGYVYLLHFSEPYKHARHYLGWTNDLPKRLREHMNGKRANCVLTYVIKNAGIEHQVVRTWAGPITLEKALKKRKNNRLLCPICNPDVKEFDCHYP